MKLRHLITQSQSQNENLHSSQPKSNFEFEQSMSEPDRVNSIYSTPLRNELTKQNEEHSVHDSHKMTPVESFNLSFLESRYEAVKENNENWEEVPQNNSPNALSHKSSSIRELKDEMKIDTKVDKLETDRPMIESKPKKPTKVNVEDKDNVLTFLDKLLKGNASSFSKKK